MLLTWETSVDFLAEHVPYRLVDTSSAHELGVVLIGNAQASIAICCGLAVSNRDGERPRFLVRRLVAGRVSYTFADHFLRFADNAASPSNPSRALMLLQLHTDAAVRWPNEPDVVGQPGGPPLVRNEQLGWGRGGDPLPGPPQRVPTVEPPPVWDQNRGEYVDPPNSRVPTWQTDTLFELHSLLYRMLPNGNPRASFERGDFALRSDTLVRVVAHLESGGDPTYLLLQWQGVEAAYRVAPEHELTRLHGGNWGSLEFLEFLQWDPAEPLPRILPPPVTARLDPLPEPPSVPTPPARSFQLQRATQPTPAGEF